MQRFWIITGTFAALGLAVWLGLRVGASAPTTMGAQPTAIPQVKSPAKIVGLATSPDLETPGGMPPTAVTGATLQAAAPNTAPGTLTGPEVIEQWMTSTDLPSIVRTSLAGFSKLDPKDHLLAMSKVAPLVPDDQFDITLKRLLVDPKTSEDAKDYLYRDVVNRAPEAKWPALFAVMNTPGDPHAQDARESLTSDLGADFGLNQGQWLARIQEALRERNMIGK